MKDNRLAKEGKEKILKKETNVDHGKSMAIAAQLSQELTADELAKAGTRQQKKPKKDGKYHLMY